MKCSSVMPEMSHGRARPNKQREIHSSRKRLEEHQSLMRTAIPDLDAAPESVRAAAAEVKNLAESIATQRIEPVVPELRRRDTRKP